MLQNLRTKLRRPVITALVVVLTTFLSALGMEAEFEGTDWPIFDRRDRAKPTSVDNPGLEDRN